MGVVSSADVPVVRSSLALPLVQLLSLPPTSLLPLLIDRTHTASNQTMAKTLLEKIKSPEITSQQKTTPLITPTTPPSSIPTSVVMSNSSSFFSNLTSSTYGYVSISEDSDHVCSWLQQLTRHNSSVQSGEGCGHLALLVAGVTMTCADSVRILKQALQTFITLCGVDPAIVSAAGFHCYFNYSW